MCWGESHNSDSVTHRVYLDRICRANFELAENYVLFVICCSFGVFPNSCLEFLYAGLIAWVQRQSLMLLVVVRVQLELHWDIQ